MKLLLVVGACCSEWHIDYRKQLLQRLLNSSHQIMTLILSAADDSLVAVAEQHHIPTQFLPPELNQSQRLARAALANSAFQMRLSAWLKPLRQRTATLGICFYGNWLPPALFELPTCGFLNFHPGPLPELRGMEPDTFAILDGRTATHGTVHLITEQFDEGAIVAVTPELPLTNCMTPPQVFRALTEMGVTTVLNAITAVETNRVVYQPQNLTRATNATRQRARVEAYLNFRQDDAAMIDRRRRAFLSQDIGICLKAEINQRVYAVLDVETWQGEFGGNVGELLGYYQGKGEFAGAPIMRIFDGIAVVRLGRALAFDTLDRAWGATPSLPEIRFDCSRSPLTTWSNIQRSLESLLETFPE
ncbi:hypothetical protein CKO09_03370 [Chromatium weissei]|nr:hypothetical protein [Chromatium weissei]